MLAVSKARGIILDDKNVCFDSAPKSIETEISIEDHAEVLDTIPERLLSSVSELQSNDNVNLQDIDDKRRRKRPEA